MASEIRSLRLTFWYDEDGVRLVRRTRRRSPAPPSEPLDRDPPSGAVMAEVRSADGEVTYRRYLVNPIPQTHECFTDTGIRRVPYVRPSGAFTTVVPPVRAHAVVVVLAGPAVRFAQPALRTPPGPGQWRELVRAPIEEGPDGRE
jgi:hypothetical protein